jgi:hypothetical protein
MCVLRLGPRYLLLYTSTHYTTIKPSNPHQNDLPLSPSSHLLAYFLYFKKFQHSLISSSLITTTTHHPCKQRRQNNHTPVMTQHQLHPAASPVPVPGPICILSRQNTMPFILVAFFLISTPVRFEVARLSERAGVWWGRDKEGQGGTFCLRGWG